MNHNIATWPADQRKAIQRDLKAAHWAHQVKIGKTTRAMVMLTISRLGDAKRISDMTQRFQRFMDMNTIGVNENRSSSECRVPARDNRPRMAGSGSSDGLWSRPIN